MGGGILSHHKMHHGIMQIPLNCEFLVGLRRKEIVLTHVMEKTIWCTLYIAHQIAWLRLNLNMRRNKSDKNDSIISCKASEGNKLLKVLLYIFFKNLSHKNPLGLQETTSYKCSPWCGSFTIFEYCILLLPIFQSGTIHPSITRAIHSGWRWPDTWT